MKNSSSSKKNKEFGSLTVLELRNSLICLVKLAQNSSFSKEINDLKSNIPISTKSKLIPLNPFLDEDGVLRVGGRIGKANIGFDQTQ